MTGSACYPASWGCADAAPFLSTRSQWGRWDALLRPTPLKATHAEILRQREQIAELLGQIRDLNTGWTETIASA